VYEAQSSWNSKHVPFDALKPEENVRIAVDFNEGIPGEWKVPRFDASWLSTRIHDMVETVMGDKRDGDEAVQGLWNTLPTDQELDEDSDDAQQID